MNVEVIASLSLTWKQSKIRDYDLCTLDSKMHMNTTGLLMKQRIRIDLRTWRNSTSCALCSTTKSVRKFVESEAPKRRSTTTKYRGCCTVHTARHSTASIPRDQDPVPKKSSREQVTLRSTPRDSRVEGSWFMDGPPHPRLTYMYCTLTYHIWP